MRFFGAIGMYCFDSFFNLLNNTTNTLCILLRRLHCAADTVVHHHSAAGKRQSQQPDQQAGRACRGWHQRHRCDYHASRCVACARVATQLTLCSACALLQ